MRLWKAVILSNFLFFNGIFNALSAQTPANDLNWQLDTAKSDEFNADTINTVKWHILDCPSGDCCNYGGSTAFEKTNATDSGGLLRLRVDGPGYAPVPCNRKTIATAGINSNGYTYSYGYFEIYAKLPGVVDSNGVGHAERFWPTFWMAYNPICSIHNEIDVMDECCCIFSDAKTTGSGWNESGEGADSCQVKSAGGLMYVSPVPLCSTFHKFAVDWDANSMVFFRDDVPYFQAYNQPSMIMNPMKLFIDLQIANSCDFYPGMTFPQYMYVDYFRYYQLKLDCNASDTLLTNADVLSYVYSVKSAITFGNGKDTISLSNNDVKYFRAVNSITVNGTFTAPLGCELGLIPTACH